MQLGIISSPNEESFIRAKNRGLDFIELCINIDIHVPDFMDQLVQIKNYISKYDVAIGSIGRWGSDRIDDQGHLIEEELKNSYQLIDACHALGCPVFVCGCNFVESLSYKDNCLAAINYFNKLITYGKEKGIKIATYNCRWSNFVHSEMAWTIIHGSLEDLGIKYDPSHCYYDGNGHYLEEIRDWGHRIYHFHLKGALKIKGERFDDPPVGMDQIHWPTVMATLYAVQYDGTLSIEPHSSNWRGELGNKGIDFTIDYIRPFIL